MTNKRFWWKCKHLETDRNLGVAFCGKTNNFCNKSKCNEMESKSQKHNQFYRERIKELEKENEQLKQEKHDWLQQKARYEQQYTEYIRENKNLKEQLYSDENGICNQCKYHYLVKDEDSELGYYNSRCKKGHYECARVSLRHCKDFEIKNMVI